MHLFDQNRSSVPGDKPQPGLIEVTDAKLGKTVRIARESAAVSVLFPQGRCQQALVATLYCTAVVPLDAYPPGVLNRRAPLVGRLQWGQGGATFSADIDIRTGIVATIVASSVSLAVQFEAADDVPDSRALFADVSAGIVWGTRGGRARVTRTLPRSTVPIAGTITYPVPQGATALTLYTTQAGWYAAGSVSTITLHGGPLVTDDPELTITAGALGVTPLVFEGLTLSGNTRFVTVDNLSGALLPLQATFLLNL